MRPLIATLLAFSITNNAVAAARFSGGMCESQGTWVQSALRQNQLIVDALSALQNDPDCKVLTQALAQAPKMEQVKAQADGAASSSSEDLASSFREISALDDFVSPEKYKNLYSQMSAHGQDPKQFQDAVFNVVFNKSYEKLKDLTTSMDITAADSQRASVRNASPRLTSFLDQSKQIANMSMATSQSILRAIPASKTCLDKNPGILPVIFGAAAHTSAALVSGGEVNGVGEFTASLINFTRDMKYAKSLKGLALENYKNSVSCLVESTSENYCAMEDAENALEAMRVGGMNTTNSLQAMLARSATDPVASPVAGLVIYMRDVPVVQAWLQKVLYGMNPRQSWQGSGKNDNWAAYLGFIQSVNSLQANFSDKEQLYYQDTAGLSPEQKMGRVREIFNDTLFVIRDARGAPINFFTRSTQSELIPFTLLGIDLPKDFNMQTNNIETMWLKWTQAGLNGFDNPDRLLQTIKDNLGKLVERAQHEANQLFEKRMVVDPLNLITEAMRGPGVSAYQSFLDQRAYYNNLVTKLQASVAQMEGDPSMKTRQNLLKSHIPLLKDSIKRLDLVINALQSVGNVDPDSADASSSKQSEKIMDVIYSAANMLTSWDNFFGTRMQTALQADLSDTLWRKTELTEAQRQYFQAVGPEIVTKLAGYFATDPVAQRTDLSAAKVSGVDNLKAIEQQFASVLFNEILDIDCKLEGGMPCDKRSLGTVYNPAGGLFARNEILALNGDLAAARANKWGSGNSILKWFYPQSDDSKALQQTKAKYCIQALAFESRDLFSEVCKGATMLSDFADRDDKLGLNADFDTLLATIHQTTASAGDGRIDRSRAAGVCALRSYLRKNHVYYMYRDYNSGN